MSDSKPKIDKYIQVLDENEELKKQLKEAKKEKLVQKLSEEMSPELSIADLELKRLLERSMAGELSLEDIKKYDLLVKNKRLAQEKSTSNISGSATEVIDVTDLVLAAGGHIIDEEKQEKDEQ